MAFSRLVFSVLMISISCYATNVPVFLWSDATKTSGSNPLETVKPAEFYKLIEEEIAGASFTAIFREKTLSVEDFSLKDDNGQTPFPYLHNNIKHSKYFASVKDPLVIVENLVDSDGNENSLSSAIENNSKFVIFKLEDAQEGESRVELLRRHDEYMRSTMEILKKRFENVLAIYTAENPSWVIPHSRVRRQAARGARDGVFDGLRLYANNIHIQDGNETITLNGLPASTTKFNGSVMDTTLTYGDNSIILQFRQAGGYWFFDSVVIYPTTQDITLYPVDEIYAQNNFSYSCSENVTFTRSANRTQTVYFHSLKVQPFFQSINESTTFGEPYYCVGFFTAPIWSALFVVFILLSITFYGIMMMMDIRTMDRFDDPKGKTITINTAE